MRVEGRRRRRERGSATVEFALVLPILVLLLGALLRVGLVARDALLVASAARAAAREAAVSDDTERIRGALLGAAVGLDRSLISHTVTRSGSRGDPVTVSVVYEDRVSAGVIWLPAVITLSATAVMRQEFG